MLATAALLCLHIIHLWNTDWTSAHQSFQLLYDPTPLSWCSQLRKEHDHVISETWRYSSARPSWTNTWPDQGSLHYSLKVRNTSLDCAARKVRSQVQHHTHTCPPVSHHLTTAVSHGTAWGRHTAWLDPSWMIVEFLLAGNIYNHLKSSRIAILPRFLCYPGSPVFMSNMMESRHVWNRHFSQTSH